MKIPGLDPLLFCGVRILHGLGAVRTARTLDPEKLRDVKSILITVTTALGDSVTFTPALSALRERFPRARIVGLYHCAFSDLYAGDPRFDRVIPYFGKYRRVRQTVEALREESCELALLPYMNDPDIIPLVLAGGSRMLFRMPGRNTIYSFLVAHPELLSSTPPPDHSNRRGADMVKHLGCTVNQLHASLHVPPDSRPRVDAALGDARAAAALIGLHPGASIAAKRWPVKWFDQLGQILTTSYPDAQIVVTGSPGDAPMCEQICRAAPAGRLLNLAGKISIRDMPELIRRLSVLVSADTGIAVMAYALDCRTVTLFWRTDPAICGPLEAGSRHRVVTGQSAESILPEQVFVEVSRHIQEDPRVRHIR